MIDPANPPQRPVPIYQLGDQQICTEGNLTVLASQAKAGKTATLGAMIACALSQDRDNDTFTFNSPSDRGGAVILFDCEQSPYDTYTIIQSTMTRAGMSQKPDCFRAYTLADVPTIKRRALLKFEMQRAAEACGGVHSVFVDGVADLCIDPNDSAEAFALVQELHTLAISFSTAIVLVLHENPNGLKTRGHLGSQLERKAESNLRLEKGDDGVTIIFGERCRHAHLPKKGGPRFKYDSEEGMHVSCEPGESQNERQDRAALISLAEQAFAASAGLRYTELQNEIMRIGHVKRNAAQTRIRKMNQSGVIRQNEHGIYVRAA